MLLHEKSLNWNFWVDAEIPFSWLQFLGGRNLKVLIVKWTGFTSSMVYWDEWPLVMIRASHHSTSGSELLVSLLGTNLANWMAEVIPVFLDMVEISACSLSNWAFIRTRWPSRWYCPGSTKLNDALGCLLAPEKIIETKFYHTWNLAINIHFSYHFICFTHDSILMITRSVQTHSNLINSQCYVIKLQNSIH